jgi:hypothetical protein
MWCKADALLNVARVFLNSGPEDRSGVDHTLVVVQVSAENLAKNVPAGTSEPPKMLALSGGVGTGPTVEARSTSGLGASAIHSTERTTPAPSGQHPWWV